MPTYFFHLRDGEDFPDDVGTELPALRDAQIGAVRLASKLLVDDDAFWGGEAWSIRVTDEKGDTVFNVSFTASDKEALNRVKN